MQVYALQERMDNGFGMVRMRMHARQARMLHPCFLLLTDVSWRDVSWASAR